MKAVLSAARVPKQVARPVRARLKRLLEFLAWTSLDPVEDVPKIVSRFSAIVSMISLGVRMEIVSEIRERAAKLKGTDDEENLWAAAELEDLAEDLEEALGKWGDPDEECGVDD